MRRAAASDQPGGLDHADDAAIHQHRRQRGQGAARVAQQAGRPLPGERYVVIRGVQAGQPQDPDQRLGLGRFGQVVPLFGQ